MILNTSGKWIIAALLPTLGWVVVARGQDPGDDHGPKARRAQTKAKQNTDDAGPPDQIGALGDDKNAPGDNKSALGDKKEGSKTKTRGDPAKSAFALPRGVVLNKKQQDAYEALKADHEDALRDAAQRLQDATDGKEETAASKELNALRAKIRAGIQDILAMPYNQAPPNSDRKSSEGSYPPPPPDGGYGYPVNPGGGYYPWYPGGYYPGYYGYHHRYWGRPYVYAPRGSQGSSNSPSPSPPPKTPPPKPRPNSGSKPKSTT
ncbi:MAG: hypothetical protein ABSF26_02345 [Thermoguttaceae bacterium]|jgi:hypothetical protein